MVILPIIHRHPAQAQDLPGIADCADPARVQELLAIADCADPALVQDDGAIPDNGFKLAFLPEIS